MPTIRSITFPRTAANDQLTEDTLNNTKSLDLPSFDMSSNADIANVTSMKEPESFSLPASGSDTQFAPNPPNGVVTRAPNPPEYNLPFWNCGLWQFKNADDGQNYQCTAFFIANPQVIMTAAHCVISLKSGKWHSDFKFIRAADGPGTYQTVNPSRICIYEEAFMGRWNAVYDYAFVSTYQKSGAGWFGCDTINLNNTQVTSVGYPGFVNQQPASPGTMYYDSGVISTSGNGINAMESNSMGHGASGGPIIKNFSQVTSANGNNMVVGVNSFGTVASTMNSPAFSMDTYNLLLNAIDNVPAL